MDTAPTDSAAPAGNWLAYDGDCPFCARYTAWMDIQQHYGPMALLNLREHPALLADLEGRGFDVDNGMVLHHDGTYYHGVDAVHRVALISTNSGVFNKINRFIFRHRWLSRVLYPVMVFGRNLTLKLLGRKKIHET